MLHLKNSEYNKKFRRNDKHDIKHLNRSRNWNCEERKMSKSKKKLNWWNNKQSVDQ